MQARTGPVDVVGPPIETEAPLYRGARLCTQCVGRANQDGDRPPRKRCQSASADDKPNTDKTTRKRTETQQETYNSWEEENSPSIPCVLEKNHNTVARSGKTMVFMGFPPEPADTRLTVEGAIVTDGGKLDIKKYLTLKDHFADEAPREKHPLPSKPGVKKEEQGQMENLKCWSDIKGEGWIVKGPYMGEATKDKWFSVKTIGSWRFAFLLARLQRDIWLKGVCIKSAIEK